MNPHVQFKNYRTKTGQVMNPPGIKIEHNFSFAWTAPRWEGGHVRSPEFRDNKDDSNLSIDSG